MTCFFIIYRLCVASKGGGLFWPVVPPSGSDWWFLLSISLTLTQPPDRTGQPALKKAHTIITHSFQLSNKKTQAVLVLFYFDEHHSDVAESWILWFHDNWTNSIIWRESAVTFRVFPVPEPLRFGPGEPTELPRAPLMPITVGEVAPGCKKTGTGSVLEVINRTSTWWLTSVLIIVSLWLVVWVWRPEPSEPYRLGSAKIQPEISDYCI